MNRSKIEWCDHTWNPITGCRHGCEYCYARRMTARFAGDVRLNRMAKRDYYLMSAADGGEELYVLNAPMLNETGIPLAYPFDFEPTLHRYRMDMPEKLKMGNNIFVGAMSDVFGKWVPDGWIDEIFAVCEKHPIHNYLFLTKNPQRYVELRDMGRLVQKANMWYGTSVTEECEIDRLKFLPMECKTFVSIEPVLGDIHPEGHSHWSHLTDWIIIGAETGRSRGKVIPEPDWIKRIVAEADSAGIPVFMKESLVPVVGEQDMRRDFPEQLQRPTMSSKMEKKLFDICAGCRTHLKKSSMITLFARSKRGEQPKQFGFMCKDCFKKFCENLSLDLPELAEMKERITISPGDGDG